MCTDDETQSRASKGAREIADDESLEDKKTKKKIPNSAYQQQVCLSFFDSLSGKRKWKCIEDS